MATPIFRQTPHFALLPFRVKMFRPPISINFDKVEPPMKEGDSANYKLTPHTLI